MAFRINRIVSKTNKERFNLEECAQWSTKTGLIKEEDYLLLKFLKNVDDSVLDLGTGNGRFLFELEKRGFQKLFGIDVAWNLLSVGKQRIREENSDIQLLLMDATSLTFDDESFNIVLGLQQILSIIENEDDRMKVLSEVFRVLKRGGLGIFSFLCWEGRSFNTFLGHFHKILRFLRDGKKLDMHYLPWLKVGKSVSLKWLWSKEPCTYWFSKEDAANLLLKQGFDIIEICTSAMIKKNNFDIFEHGGILYIVVRKVNSSP